ncbi:nuclease-related domain-containing protein [Bacillus massilinigeriensis]|uniref:nuclease-related domain-containing protein n=1 Tax=Bacillus massilionigeriensis TaxID=1805475 RepID=UPI00096B3F2F|nr:nuclease-related domain-containing protein [Bacillus massilionigeriensis]
MIVKERSIPLRLRVDEALLRRIHVENPKRSMIQEDLAKMNAGYKGEQAIDYYINFLSQENYHIFHDLRLKKDDLFFQIDTLILTLKFILIIEIKNIAGSIYFEPIFKQLIRTNDEKEEGFPDPISQAQRKQQLLIKWLKSHKFPVIPIDYLIVISFPSTIINSSKRMSKYYQKICHLHTFQEKVEELNQHYQEQKLTTRELNKLKKLLLKSHTPLKNHPPCPFNIQESEILTGVQCPSCLHTPMIRVKGNWSCPKCQTKSKDAHIQAVNDYFLLFDHTMTNQQMREYLHLKSPDTATRLLVSMDLSFTGSGKGRVYFNNND